jgi:hypothetical protein
MTAVLRKSIKSVKHFYISVKFRTHDQTQIIGINLIKLTEYVFLSTFMNNEIIAVHYMLNGPGIESWYRQDFPHRSRPALAPLQWVPGHFWGAKQTRRGVDHPPKYSAKVNERVELYLYSPSGPSLTVLGQNLPILLPLHVSYTQKN